ncbi:MAG TPA: chemotaxis-specific protein-glutamate methyltransferase CheB [Fibrobacteria bacterium]|nr:chemotaxis-specific protein-glutamate methyltransferase CheB [Fibrobacteria bacterium]
MPETSLEAPLDILVVDDSPTYRMILSRVLRGWPKANLVGTAGDGMAALSAIQEKRPQLVLLDVSMPVLDGIETLRRIRKTYADVDVIMLSSLDPSQTGLTMQALSLGALDFVPKPQGDNPAESFTALSAGLFPLLELASARHRRRLARQEAAQTSASQAPRRTRPDPGPPNPTNILPPPRTLPPATGIVQAPPEPTVRSIPRPGPGPTKPAAGSGRRLPNHPELVAIGVSTGGPNALHVLVPALPANFPLPIVCVQHMPPLFTASLAERLDRDSALKVLEGSEGAFLEPGTLHIAPGGSHMVVVRGADGRLRLSLRSDPPLHSCRPSVDVLFRSVSEICPGPVVSVVLTGMGSDGADGVALLRAKGSWSIVQDEATSVVWGMPGAVHAAGNADETLPLESIARRLVDIAAGKGARP